ncbi:MAG TPA: hypothetical protein VGY54_07190, partial [Polyangiaceae bacterium]|nr:hypothetical protein [Polyangiaceae bacterium]
MRTTVIRSFLATVALASAACGGGGGSTGPAPVTLEVDTWWVSTTELAPIQAVVQMHESAFPNVTVKVVTAADAATMDSDVTHRFAAGSPPAALQANLGGNALQFGSSALALMPSWTS